MDFTRLPTFAHIRPARRLALSLTQCLTLMLAMTSAPHAFAQQTPHQTPTQDTATPAEHHAAQPQIVLELFTSQACDKCPSANTLMGELIDDPRILGLSFSVDYWNVMGWRDTLAQPAFTQRQRAYVATLDNRRVYTPQFVINGHTNLMGAAPYHETTRSAITAALSNTTPRPDDAAHPENTTSPITTQWTAQGITLTLPGTITEHTATVWLAEYTPGATAVPVRSGSNRGETLLIHNAVTQLTQIPLPVDTAATPHTLSLEAPSSPALAILLQHNETLQIFAVSTASRPAPQSP